MLDDNRALTAIQASLDAGGQTVTIESAVHEDHHQLIGACDDYTDTETGTEYYAWIGDKKWSVFATRSADSPPPDYVEDYSDLPRLIAPRMVQSVRDMVQSATDDADLSEEKIEELVALTIQEMHRILA